MKYDVTIPSANKLRVNSFGLGGEVSGGINDIYLKVLFYSCGLFT